MSTFLSGEDYLTKGGHDHLLIIRERSFTGAFNYRDTIQAGVLHVSRN